MFQWCLLFLEMVLTTLTLSLSRVKESKSMKHIDNIAVPAPKVFCGSNKVMPQASQCATLSYTTEKGRHLCVSTGFCFAVFYSISHPILHNRERQTPLCEYMFLFCCILLYQPPYPTQQRKADTFVWVQVFVLLYSTLSANGFFFSHEYILTAWISF